MQNQSRVFLGDSPSTVQYCYIAGGAPGPRPGCCLCNSLIFLIFDFLHHNPSTPRPPHLQSS